MTTIKKFEDLEVWQKSRDLCKRIYDILQEERISKDYKLKDQMNGSSGSIMDNIAEGFDRDGKNEFKQFLAYSKGSTGELKSQLYRALDRKYITQEQFDELYKEIQFISNSLGGFMKYLRGTDIKGQKFKEPGMDYGGIYFDDVEFN
jgi:four helix bundle protein